MSLPRLAKPLMTAVAATAVLTAAACGSTDDDAGSSSTEETTQDSAGGDTDSEAGGDYADGTYEASGSYSNPGGTSDVSVSLTIADNAVTDVTVTPEASGTSRQFQEEFAGGIADEVVGVPVDDLDVARVAGSSLTAGGFNEALEQIKSDAAA